ncbi:hypothetical protein K2173_024503 [Erythroxylum novogranatense]|uniref:OVATE domain-containing protein n=1 Tax=Erythroxylum novogranatense TaxID=1862640 RepID=A0AAV8SVK2_9ROSI|nr:hypothetical protein K2173_024503 [Erythroxylum novogranatense]
MQLRESIKKTKNMFHATRRRLRSLFFAEYGKFFKPIICNLFSCGRVNVKNKLADRYYTDFCNELECDLEKALKRKNTTFMATQETKPEQSDSDGGSVKFASTQLKEKEEAEEEKEKKCPPVKKPEEECPNNIKEGGYPLADKMKELEKMNLCDVEDALDVEEAVHYYSRLNSPVYLGIVDKFLTDMYTEFSAPQATVSFNVSK